MAFPKRHAGTPLTAAEYNGNLGYASLAALMASTENYSDYATDDLIRVHAEGWLYKVAASGATDHHLTTAGGVKLYVQPLPTGEYHFGAFNPHGDGVTDDYATFMKAVNVETWSTGWYTRGPILLIPDATFYMSQTIELKRIINIRGLGTGTTFQGGATFKFPTNTRGLVINRYNTLDGDVEATPTTAADDCRIENLRLDGTSVSTDPTVRDVNACGIRMKASASLRNVMVKRFSGDGYNITAAVSGEGGTGDLLGNCNYWQMYECHGIENGRHGLFVQGSDANAGTCIAGNFTYNGQFGIRDNSFLGNTYIACHTATNGVGVSAGHTSGGGSRVTYEGNRYYTKYKYLTTPTGGRGVSDQDPAQDLLYTTTTPGTDSTVWAPDGTGEAWQFYPEWVAGKPQGTYPLGGGMFFSNNNARTLALGCYSENDQNGALYTGGLVQVVGGIQEKIFEGGQIAASNGNNFKDLGSVDTRDKTNLIDVTMGGTSAMLTFAKDAKGLPWRLKWAAEDLVFDYGNSEPALIFSGHTTTEDFGTGSPQPYRTIIPKLALGPPARRRIHTVNETVPTTGLHARGEIVWNRDPVAGGFAGWICVTTGTPGTWKTFGVISV